MDSRLNRLFPGQFDVFACCGPRFTQYEPPPHHRRPAITVSPLQATLADSRPSCRDAILDAVARLQVRTGAAELTRRDIVAEVRKADDGFERQTIYRCLRRMTGHEPGSAHRDLKDLGDNGLQLRA